MGAPPAFKVLRKHDDPHPTPVLSGTTFDQEAILPLTLIRQHAKIDDVISVTDELLSLYRDASLRAAEEYTGLLFRSQEVIHQDVSDKRDIANGARWKATYTVNLKRPTADGILYLYGSLHSPNVRTIIVPPGSQKVQIPYEHFALDMTPCCADPCGKRPANHGCMLMYRAGLAKCEDIPANIKLGCLKYITWVVNNPGGGTGQRNYADSNPQTSGNNTAWQSGAIEEWRLVVQDAY